MNFVFKFKKAYFILIDSVIMRTFWNWIANNISNIFNAFGIILTLYFGIFYVPDWLTDARNEKILNAQRDLEQSIKELIYSDSLCKYSEIESLIKAKEILIHETFPLTREDVLTKAQESFMEDRFLPLDKRKELIFEIDLLKKQVPLVNDRVKTKGTHLENSIVELISVLLSIVAAITGIISCYLKFRKEKEKSEEITNQIMEAESSDSSLESAYEFEKSLLKEIESHIGVKVNYKVGANDSGFDLKFQFKEQQYFVVIKYLTKSKVGLNSIQSFFSRMKGLKENSGLSIILN